MEHITITYAEDDIDLRTITANSKQLKKIAERYDLHPNEAACFTNKARTRFRLVLELGVGKKRATFLCIPEIDERAKYGVYLRISEMLAGLSGVATNVVFFEHLMEKTKKRIDRSELIRKRRLEKAKEELADAILERKTGTRQGGRRKK